MEILIVGGGMSAAVRRSIFEALTAIENQEHNGDVITIDSATERQGEIKKSIDKAYARNLRAFDILDVPAEWEFSYTYNDHHYHNLTAPTVAFDRVQQRRKAIAKQHYNKPPRKAKHREKTHVKVSWR